MKIRSVRFIDVVCSTHEAGEKFLENVSYGIAKPEHRCEDNIKTDRNETASVRVFWIHVALVRGHR